MKRRSFLGWMLGASVAPALAKVLPSPPAEGKPARSTLREGTVESAELDTKSGLEGLVEVDEPGAVNWVTDEFLGPVDIYEHASGRVVKF